MGDLREPSGVVLEESPSSSSSSSLSFPGREVWARAERATQEIIRKVQPSVVSEERRKDVIDYVQRLVKGKLGCEVFPFGSVPLKTYLPDGDIDLTAFCRFDLEESYANDLFTVLEREDHNPDAEFVVKDVQYIRAEVKLVKCLVQNIVVDISFNQIGGLCTLCFLEEVDRLIGKDNLFKCCIILIKAWCYYESRILGAHHGLISTYALETLVLHIFHLFHSSLSGPLAVLYKFLDYFSKFDWENYCVSLSGRVHVSSLPEIVAERPENGGVDLLLSHDFMRECVKKFCVPSRGTETNSRTFMQKHLNIVDPLKENNNLGRSVSKGNFFRIRSAFSYGARKLGQILSQPQKNIAEEVRRFFTNTLDRHGQGHRPDVQDLLLLSRCDGFVTELLFPGAEPSQEESYTHEVESVNGECGVNSEDIRNLRITNVDKSENGKMENGDLNENSHDLDSKPIYSNTKLSSITRSCEKLNLLPDLSGDVDSQLDSLGYGRWWYEFDNFWATSPPPLFQQWDANAIQQSLQFRWDMVPHVNVNGVVPRPAFSPVIPPVVEMPKARGTGTYFPIMNHHSYRDRRGRIQGPVKSPRTNGRAPTTRDRSPRARSPVHQGPGKPICSDFYDSSPRGKVFKETNGFVHTSEKADEFAVLRKLPLDTPLPERASNKAPDSSPPGSYNGESVLLVNNDRLPVRTYRLKDDEDFPPLSA